MAQGEQLTLTSIIATFAKSAIVSLFTWGSQHMPVNTTRVATFAFPIIGLLALTPAAAVLVAEAAPAVSTAAGKRLAEERCSRCHATGAKGESPARAAPPFRELGPEPIAMLEAARTSGLIAGHDEMPMFDVTRAQIDSLIAYVRQLAKRK